jgi:putative MATE family efflux protein
MTDKIMSSNKISLLKLFKQAIRGDIKDFTTGSIDKAIFLLSVPMILEMVLESLFAVVDIFFVNKLGKEAVTTVGLTESLMYIVYSLAIGLSMGTAAIVARRTGEKNFKAIGDIAMQAIYISIGIAIVLGLTGIIFAKELLSMMGAGETVVNSGYRFTQIMFGGNIVIMLLFLNNAVFRGAGDAAIAMRVLWIANIINIILDPILIFGLGPVPALGVTGAAIATTTGRGIAVLVQLYYLWKGKGVLKVLKEHLSVKWDIIKQILQLSVGGVGQYVIASCSWIFLMRIISDFGQDAVTGYQTALRVIVFTILPAWGFANAAATLVGQNLGAGKPERAEKSVWRTAFLTMLFFIFIAIVFLLFANPILSVFIHDAVSLSYGVECLHIIALGYLFFSYGMIISQSFNGAGDTKTPTILNFVCFWLLQIPLSWFMAKWLQMGPKGVYFAIGISEASLALICIVIFKQGKWKQVKV